MHAIDTECSTPVCLSQTGHGMLVMGSQHPAGLTYCPSLSMHRLCSSLSAIHLPAMGQQGL